MSPPTNAYTYEENTNVKWKFVCEKFAKQNKLLVGGYVVGLVFQSFHWKSYLVTGDGRCSLLIP